MKNYKGQTSLVLILLAAIALIFFAVTLNWGRVSQIKNMTTTAATNAAANTVSGIASYGESLIQSQLDGGFEKSKFARWVVVGLSFLAAAILIIVTFGAATPVAVMIVLVVGGAAATLITVYSDVKTVRTFNQMQNKLPLKDRFLEQGLSAGAQSLISDQNKIADYFDINTNGKFGSASGDKISRYGFFYTERLKALKKQMTGMDLTVFLDGLGVLLGQLSEGCRKPDGTPLDVPQCDRCCQPLTTATGTRLRPTSCPNNLSGRCPADGYPFVYDRTYPDYDAASDPLIFAASSFLAKFGVDTEKRVFMDTKGDEKGSNTKGIFRLLWNMAFMSEDPNRKECRNECLSANGKIDFRAADKIKPPWHFYAADYDQPNPATGKNDLTVELCADNLTPEQTASGEFYWRMGAEQYCSTTWPYNACPKYKCSATACPSCTPAALKQDKNSWPEDPLDDVLYSLKEFYAWSKLLLAQDDDTLNANLTEWYPEAAVWIGPECDGSNAEVCMNGGGILFKIRDRLEGWRKYVDDWLKGTYKQPNAWCLPPAGSAYGAQMPPDEIGTIQAAGPWGTWEAVIACLDWNSGNAGRFKQCLDDLDVITCSGTPLPSECQSVPEYPGPGAPPAYDACSNAPFTDWLTQTIAAAQAAGNQADVAALGECQTAASGAECLPSSGKPASCENNNLPRSLHCTGPGTTGDELWPPNFPAYCPPVPEYDPCNPDPQFKKWVNTSYQLAGPQGAKFAARAEYLRGLKEEAEKIRDTLEDGHTMFDDFLKAGGPLTPLMDALQNYQLYLDKMPNFLVYGWQSPVDPKDPSGVQRWHMVRTEGMGPGKCLSSGKCEYGTGNNDNLPHIETDTGGFLWTRQRSKLKDYDGRILTRVTRWDEERPATTTFNNTVPVWNFHFGKPGTVPGSAAGLAACQGQGLGIAGNYIVNSGVAADQQSVRQAFMLNTVPSDPFNTIPANCWAAADSLLSQGTKTTVCAVYTGNRSTNHMEVKFVPCPAGAFDENRTLGR